MRPMHTIISYVGNMPYWPIVSKVSAFISRTTKLDIARERLAKTDKKIVSLLSHFEVASGAVAKPDTAYLASFMNTYPLPAEVVQLSIDRNTPIELFAGVAQFIKTSSLKSKKAEFIELCHELCDRHDHSRLVVEHKKANADQFLGNDGRVITFVKDQHNRVVERAGNFAKEIDIDEDNASHIKLSRRVIEFCALAGAAWQDQAINDNEGPFVEQVTNDRTYVIPYPDAKLAA